MLRLYRFSTVIANKFL